MDQTKSIEIDGVWYEGVEYEKPRAGLNQALNIFAENIPEIKEACQLNILHIVQSNKAMPPSGNDALDWVRDEVRKLTIQNGVENYQKTLKRIASIEAHKRNPYRSSITDEMIERAREYPCTEIYDGDLKGPESGRRWGLSPFNNEKTPSFCIHPDNRWSCFSSNQHGDSIALYIHLNNCSFKEAVSKLQ